MFRPHVSTPRYTTVRRFLLLVVIAAVVAAAGTVSGAGDRRQPIHGELKRAHFEYDKRIERTGAREKDGALGDAAAGSDRYDMLGHDLDLKIDPDREWIEGAVVFRFESLEEGLDVMVLDLASSLAVDGVTDSGGALAYTHDADSLSITLREPLARGAEETVTVSYSGHPVEPDMDRGLLFRLHLDTEGELNRPIVANLSQPAYAKYWWPCKDKPRDKAFSSVRLTVPDGLVAVSNGTLESEGPSGQPGWTSFSWREAYPIASYLVSVAVSDYELLESECVTTLGADLDYDVPLRNWVFPRHVQNARTDFAPLCDMMEVCEERFGPYPFRGEKYGHAEFIWWGAMEHQTVTSIGTSSLTGLGTSDWLIVHELAHQWFGDHLTPRNWRDIWLNEGFATYSEALWKEAQEGPDAYLDDLDAARNELQWERQGPVYDPVPVFPGRVIYDKGAWIVHMLRGRMGDEAFFDLLAEWGRTGSPDSETTGGAPHLGYTVTTEEFIALAEDYAGEDLDAFLWPYLTETQLPEIVFAREIQDGGAGPDTRLQVDLRQVQEPLYDNVFPIEVTTTAGVETRTVRLNERTASAVFEFSDAIRLVALDPDRWVLWNPAPGTGSAPGITLVSPNPSRGTVLTVRYVLDSPSRVVFRVYDVMGREVFLRDLGTVADEAGFNELVWDQKGRGGAGLASGVYWATLEIDGVRSVRKFTIVH